jgi:hypothetical protein
VVAARGRSPGTVVPKCSLRDLGAPLDALIADGIRASARLPGP